MVHVNFTAVEMGYFDGRYVPRLSFTSIEKDLAIDFDDFFFFFGFFD